MKFLQVWIGKPIPASFQLHLLKSFLERFWILLLLFIKRICSSRIARCINWYYISRIRLTKLFLIDNQTIYMSGFFKTVSSLRQNSFACLPAITGREAFVVLEKAGGAPSRRVVSESPEAWLPAATIGGPQALSPGGWGGSQRVAFCSVKVPIFFAGQPWS